MATTDDGSGSSHQCRVSSGSSHQCRVTSGSSTTLTIPTMTYAEIGATGMMVVGTWVRKSRYGDGITCGCFLCLSSLLPFFGSRPSTNGVGMGFYHLQSQSSGGGFSPCARSTERSPCAVLIGCGTYGFVRLRTWNGCLICSFSFLSFPTLVRDYATQEVCT
jgi:hypothetical protein